MNERQGRTFANIFAEETLTLLPDFIADAKLLSQAINQQNHAAEE